MSGISVDNIININSIVDESTFNPAINAGLFLTKNSIIPTSELVKRFTRADAVGEYFGLSSVEYARSINYFTNADTLITRAPYVLFGRYIDEAIAPYTRGSQVVGSTALATLNAITSGSLTVTFDSTNTTISSINLSAAGSFSAIAAILQAALITAGLASATVTYDSVTKAFTISNGVVTGTSTVNYCAVSPLATALAITEATGAVLSQGSVALTEAENMDAITNWNPSYFSFTSIFDLSGSANYAIVENLNAWATTQNYKRAFVLSTSESNLTIVDNASNIVGDMADHNPKQAELNADATDSILTNTAIVYESADTVGQVAAFIMGMAASVDYTRPNSALSIAFKKQSGLTPSVTTQSAYNALLQKSVNFFGYFRSSFNNFDFTYNGKAGTPFGWFDFLANQAWLYNTIQDSVMVLLTTSAIVPNDQNGFASVKAVILPIADEAIAAGVITIGVTLSAEQKAEVLQQSGGVDFSGEITRNGYAMQFTLPTPEQRANRIAPPVNFWYANAGSINSLTFNLIFVK